MKKVLFSLLLMFSALVVRGASADWYLYLYSSEYGLNGDVAQFATTSDANVFKATNVSITASGINFSVHNSSWGKQYGWSSASVTSTGTAVKLASASQATGWCKLPAGTYDVTFNSLDLTIQFDTPTSTEYEDKQAKVGGIIYNFSADGTAEVASKNFLRGGDISMLKYVEDLGAVFYDENGTSKDALQIMKENGVNIVRLRVYNTPGNEVTYDGTTYKLPSGYVDKTDMLALAKRAKAAGMQIELTLHYSDFWTNASRQFKPSDWKNYNISKLKSAVASYTEEVLQAMVDQGTAPEYVSLGNEIQSGLLFGDYSSLDPTNGYASTNPANMAALLNAGAAVVRDICPDAKIILHFTLSDTIGKDTYDWLLGTSGSGLGLGTKSSSNYVDFDIVGASYYPYYTNEKPTMLTTLANAMYSYYGKELMIMEVGYSWTQYKPSGRNGGNYEGQLHLNGTAYNEATEAGQLSFMQEVNDVVKANDHILGYLYWDPVMVDQKVNGSWIESCWALKKSGNTWYQDGNDVSNTTWFDYNGKALSVMEAFAQENVTVPSEVTYNGMTYTVNYEGEDEESGDDDTTPTSGTYVADGIIYTWNCEDSANPYAYVSGYTDAAGDLEDEGVTLLNEFTVNDITFYPSSIAEWSLEGLPLYWVVIPKSYNAIGKGAFYKSSVANVTIEGEYMTIWDYAFTGWDSSLSDGNMGSKGSLLYNIYLPYATDMSNISISTNAFNASDISGAVLWVADGLQYDSTLNALGFGAVLPNRTITIADVAKTVKNLPAKVGIYVDKVLGR